jgi:hypothetical protein
MHRVDREDRMRVRGAGLGRGHMPLHMVKADLDSGVLVKIRLEAIPRAVLMPMSVVFRKDAPLITGKCVGWRELPQACDQLTLTVP